MIEREVMRLKGDEVMRDCRPGMLLKIAAFLLFLVFFLPMTGLCLYLAFAPSLPREERLLFAAGALMFGGLVAFAVYRWQVRLCMAEQGMQGVQGEPGTAAG